MCSKVPEPFLEMARRLCCTEGLNQTPYLIKSQDRIAFRESRMAKEQGFDDEDGFLGEGVLKQRPNLKVGPRFER